MSQRVINLGSGYNTNDGDKLRDGGDDINKNFAELYKRAVPWILGTYDALTAVIVANKLYILSDTVTLPFSSSNFGNELADGDWLEVGAGSTATQSNWAESDDQNPTFIKNKPDMPMDWKGQWVQASYDHGMTVWTSSFMGVSKIDGNTDVFPPQPSGEPVDPYSGTWPETTTTARQLMIGTRFMPSLALGVEKLTIAVKAGYHYDIYGIQDPLGDKIVTQIISITTDEDELQDISNGFYVDAGKVYDIVAVVTEPDPTPTDTILNYDYATPNNPNTPGVGVISQANNEVNVLRVNKEDEDGGDNSVFLLSLLSGDQIVKDGVSWTIQSVTEDGNTVHFNVLPPLQIGDDGLSAFTFRQNAETLLTHIFDNNYWSTNTNAQGLFIADGHYDDIVPNENFYGITATFQQYNTSDNWDYMPIGEGGGSGGEATIEIVDDLITQDATKALSANQGYVLDNKKLNTVYQGSGVLIDKANPLEPVISAIPQTTAGILTRVYFTGDPEITTEDTFYKTSAADKGTVQTIDQTVTNGDNQTTFFAQDFIGNATTEEDTLVGGNYTGVVDVEVSSNAGNQRYDIEIYVTDDQGVPFDSGITGAPTGDLGFQVLALASTGVFDIEDDNPTAITYAFTVAESLVIPAGTRVRYHISATKVGTDGPNVIMHLYSGYDWTTYLDAPSSVTTETVLNEDDQVPGSTQAEVNTHFEDNKIPLEGGEEWRMTGMIYGGDVTDGTTPDGRITKKTLQLAGFVTYQLIETAVGSGTFEGSEGLGEFALENNTGKSCVALGYRSLQSNSAEGVTALGPRSGELNQGTYGIFLGGSAGFENTGGSIIAIGSQSASDNTGNSCVFIAESSGKRNSGYSCIGIGKSSMTDATGNFNVALGELVLTAVSGEYNVAVGYRAGTDEYDTEVPMPFSNTTSLGANSLPDKDNQVKLGDENVISVKVGNDNYKALDEADLVPKSQTAISDLTNEMTGATKADNQVVISDADYGDGSTAVTGTLYFIKP